MSKSTRKKSSPQAARFRTTRKAHRDETGEDYVEAVAQLIDERGEARVRDLALMMGVSHVTVSRIVRRLDDEGLLISTPYQPIQLTSAGARLAERCLERHETVLAFLRAIGVSRSQAEIDTEGIEHHVSDETINAMRRAMRRLAR
ncbi:MAG: manganese-binding transcriptional regulator MntR [Planctomycetota bacterium]|jgi:DtxR family manganese transport transcriptional regulator